MIIITIIIIILLNDRPTFFPTSKTDGHSDVFSPWDLYYRKAIQIINDNSIW